MCNLWSKYFGCLLLLLKLRFSAFNRLARKNLKQTRNQVDHSSSTPGAIHSRNGFLRKILLFQATTDIPDWLAECTDSKDQVIGPNCWVLRRTFIIFSKIDASKFFMSVRDRHWLLYSLAFVVARHKSSCSGRPLKWFNWLGCDWMNNNYHHHLLINYLRWTARHRCLMSFPRAICIHYCRSPLLPPRPASTIKWGSIVL